MSSFVSTLPPLVCKPAQLPVNASLDRTDNNSHQVTKNHSRMPEDVQLEFIKEIGFTHMRIADGVETLLQLTGLCARLCAVSQAGR